MRPRSDAPGPVNGPNVLLAALPDHEAAALIGKEDPVSLAGGDVLYQPGQVISHVYFPTSGVVSLLAVQPRGRALEIGLVGREGLVGLPIFLGRERANGRVVVPAAGEAFRVPTEVFQGFLGRDGPLHALLLRYTHYFLGQITQAAICAAMHPVEKRLCRWLLMLHRRVGHDRFPLTHLFLANMLGVRRASVTEAARHLQDRELIHCTRGQIRVLDRTKLERACCECFRVSETDYMHRVAPSE